MSNSKLRKLIKQTSQVGVSVELETIPDQPVQILSYNKENKRFQLNISELDAILQSPDVRDANIAVVSITGAFRKGKSFMLSFFLRYLNETYINDREDWLGSEDTELSGFAWCGGSERHTTGIWIWPKVFTKVLPNGETIGVMLMDTQGTFDNTSTMQDNVTIFSLSCMLSSIQIYNLFNNIQEDDLQHLQLFTEYGKLALEQTDEKAFQTLLFLIRDWSFPYESSYGFAGGQELLKRKLQVNADYGEELAYVRNHIKSCYEKLDCFLMPHPGRAATISRNFAGQLKDIDPDFKQMLREFVPALLAPENVSPKKISGSKVTGKTFITYIESYWNIFSKGGTPTAHTILGATAEANNLASKSEAIELYHREMRAATGSDKAILQFTEMIDLHNNMLKQSLELFRAKAVIGDERLKTNYYNNLSVSLQELMVIYLGVNESKNSKNMEETIANLSSQINNYQSTNTQHIAVLQCLKGQMDEYRRSSDSEKRRLQREIEELRRQLAANGGRGRQGQCTIL